MALTVEYEGKTYTLDLEDMDLQEAQAMERFGVKSLKDLEEGISVGNLSALTVAFWLMLRQSGEGDVRIDRVRFRPVKYVKALIAAAQKVLDAEAAEEAEGNDQGD